MNVTCPKCGKVQEMKYGGTPSDYECPDCAVDCIAYKEEEKEPVTVDDVEILRTGKWKGLKWSKEDLDHVIRNFRNGIAKIGLKVTKDGSHEGKPLVQPGGASLGWVDRLWRKGEKLMARFCEVPKEIGKLIKKGAISQKSVEGREHFVTGDGQDHGRALTGCLFFGANGVPAVHGLSDLVKLYKLEEGEPASGFAYRETDYEPTEERNADSDNNPETGARESKNDQGGASSVDITLKQEEYKTLVADASKLSVVESERDKATAELAEIKLQLESATNSLTKAEDALKGYREREEAHTRNEMRTFAHKLVEEGKINKDAEDSEVEHLLTLEGDARKDRMDRLVKLQSCYGDKVAAQVPVADGASDDLDLDSLDERTEAAIAYQKKEGVQFGEAFKKVGG